MFSKETIGIQISLPQLFNMQSNCKSFDLEQLWAGLTCFDRFNTGPDSIQSEIKSNKERARDNKDEKGLDRYTPKTHRINPF